jgi:hypothetical protein
MKIILTTLISTLFLLGCRDNTKNRTASDKGKIETRSTESNYFYGPTISTLKGKIIMRTFWGPPNFGADTSVDRKEVCPILLLDNPINMAADTTDEFNERKIGVTKIQLVTDKSVGNFIEKKVTVTGTLFGAMTGHHHTDVLLMLIDLRENANR